MELSLEAYLSDEAVKTRKEQILGGRTMPIAPVGTSVRDILTTRVKEPGISGMIGDYVGQLEGVKGREVLERRTGEASINQLLDQIVHEGGISSMIGDYAAQLELAPLYELAEEQVLEEKGEAEDIVKLQLDKRMKKIDISEFIKDRSSNEGAFSITYEGRPVFEFNTGKTYGNSGEISIEELFRTYSYYLKDGEDFDFIEDFGSQENEYLIKKVVKGAKALTNAMFKDPRDQALFKGFLKGRDETSEILSALAQQ